MFVVFEVCHLSGVFLIHCEQVWNGSHEQDGVEEALGKVVSVKEFAKAVPLTICW